MGPVEHEKIRVKYYQEAIRYMDNTRETLKKAGKVDRFYKVRNRLGGVVETPVVQF